MDQGSGTVDENNVDQFRYRRGSAWIGAIAAGLLLAATVLGISVGADLSKSTEIFMGVAAVLLLSALVLLFVYLARRAPVQLRVGPAGLDMAVGFAEPLAWRDIHRIRYLGETKHLTGKQAWLVVDPAPGVIPEYRLAGPRFVEAWLLRKIGVRIPLHMLDAEPDVVIRSIERFRPVQRDPR